MDEDLNPVVVELPRVQQVCSVNHLLLELTDVSIPALRDILAALAASPSTRSLQLVLIGLTGSLFSAEWPTELMVQSFRQTIAPYLLKIDDVFLTTITNRDSLADPNLLRGLTGDKGWIHVLEFPEMSRCSRQWIGGALDCATGLFE